MKIKQSLKKRLFDKARTAILSLAALVIGQQAVWAQTLTEVDCSAGLAYVTVNREGIDNYLYSMALNATSPILVGELPTTLNGLAYNPEDKFLYAISAAGVVYRIGANAEYESVTVTGTSSGFSAGDISPAGIYYIFNNSTKVLVSIDLTEATPAATSIRTLTELNTAETIDDFVYSSADGIIYAVTNQRRLLAINPANGAVTVKGAITGDLPATGTKGTAFMDAAGNLYIGQNVGGTLYRITNPSGAGPWVATSFSTALSAIDGTILDGARCASVVPPSANPDTRTLTSMSAVTLPVINGPGTGIGVDGEGSYSIDLTSVILAIPATGHNLTNPVLSNGGKTLTADEGTFQVNNDGTVSFTPAQNFNKSIVVNYTIKDVEGNESNPTTIAITADGTLPVEFGALSAILTDGQLVVNWSTLTETGNSYFDIEVSKDGTNFTKIGTVNSKAKDGNSDVSISYDFSVNLQSSTTLLGIALFSIAFIALLFSRKNKWVYTIVLVGGLSIFGASSCSKNDTAGVEDSGKVFVRIRQVDKDGTFAYSKPVQVVKK